MKFELDDPKLTAYALGELDDAEKAEVEAFLNENEAARDEVAKIRETAQWLTTELGAEKPEGLSELDQARIMDKAKERPASNGFRKDWFGLAAACAVVCILGWMAFTTGPMMLERAGGGQLAREYGSSGTPTSGIRTGSETSVTTQAPANNEGAVADKLSRTDLNGRDQSAVTTPSAKPETKVEEERQLQAAAGSVSANAPLSDEERATVDGMLGKLNAVPPDYRKVQVARDPMKPLMGEMSPKPAFEAEGSQAPVPASQPVPQKDEFATVGVRTMSQQSVIDLPDDKQAAQTPPAAAQAPATPQSTNLYGTPADQKAKEQVNSLGYVRSNAPGVAGGKSDLSKGAGANLYQSYINVNDLQRMQVPPPPPTPVPGSESYPTLPESNFLRALDNPLSTFGVDVDTASYANVRRFLTQGTLPPADAVRIEEMINYFKYEYPAPEGGSPFSVSVDAHPCPWNTAHTLARIGIRGKEMNTETRPPANLVFLIDVSGSMQSEDKLPLLKKGMKLLTQTIAAQDRVSIVTYASGVGIQLYPTPGDNKIAIERIIDSLQAGGSTNGQGGIQAAYEMARAAFIQNGINRVILATDGDFNVGISDTNTLVSMIEQQAKTGVALSVLGFGEGNLKDERLMSLADKGNGNYAYIDSFQEARKALLEQATGTLFTIAKDVKIQVEFNPGKVGAYRLIGYEKRALAVQDFNDDRKDAGEIGAGHTVTALYELVPPGEAIISQPQVDGLKYQQTAPAQTEATVPPNTSEDLMTVKLRFKQPNGDTSTRFDVPVPASIISAETKPDFQFASAVAAFGMLLRHSSHAGQANWDMIANLAQQGRGSDPEGLRAEFINLVRTASALMGTPQPMLK